MYRLVLLLVIVALASSVEASDNIRFADCANHEITAMHLKGCTSKELVCPLHKGQSVPFSMEFVANQDTKSVKLEMKANINGIEIDAPGLDHDACKSHLTCPLTKGQKYTFHYDFNLPKILPNVRTIVTTRLVGDHGVLSCSRTNNELVD